MFCAQVPPSGKMSALKILSEGSKPLYTVGSLRLVLVAERVVFDDKGSLPDRGGLVLQRLSRPLRLCRPCVVGRHRFGDRWVDWS